MDDVLLDVGIRRRPVHLSQELIARRIVALAEDDDGILLELLVGARLLCELAHERHRQNPGVRCQEAAAVVADIERPTFRDVRKPADLWPKPRAKDRLGDIREAFEHARITVL